MAETDLKIKDAPLSTNISGNVRMAGSDGSGLPVAISLSQVYDFINNGLKSDAYFATKEESDNRYPKKSDVVKMMPVEVFMILFSYTETGTTMTEDDYNTILSFVTTTTPSSSNYGIHSYTYNSYLAVHPGMGVVKVNITNSSNEIRIQAYMTVDIGREGYMVWVISKEDKLVTFSQSQKLIHTEAAGEIGIDVESLDSNGSPIGGSITLKTNGSGDKVLCDNGEYIPINIRPDGVQLDTEPTGDTLTYIVGGVTYNFELGMSAIYPDAESDDGYGISFFKGTNTEGKAIWGKGGGGGSLNETVVISLVSNQDESATPDADLLGKSVHVIYGDQDKDLVWQGMPLKVTVPYNETYQVVFPTDDRYKCPDPQINTAIIGNAREVKGLYYTEAVTVNVTCDDSTSAEGQQVTINGTVYDVDATGSVTAKIPFEVEYTVSVNTKSGYTSPSSVTETANSKTKTISMEYILIAYGVFIEATDGTLHQSTEWTGAKTANSIVVRQPTTAFRIALTQSSNMMQIHSSSSGTLENYMTAINDVAQAKLDMKSAENTANIMKLQSGTDYAAGYCNSFTFPDGKTKGLLPALGWLQTAYDNKAAVDACLAACGATAMDTSNYHYHWASTFYGVLSGDYRVCWLLGWSGGIVDGNDLSYSLRVRPFAEYA